LPATGRQEDPLARPGLTVTRMHACMLLLLCRCYKRDGPA
jgi:hypothetical protein